MTQPTINVHLWDKTAANNGASDAGVPWPENMNRQQVNDSARAGNAAIARYRDLLNATITTGGSANAQTFTSGHSYLVGDTIPAGFRARLKAGFTSTGAMTLAMDSVAAKNVKDVLGADPGPGATVLNHYFQVIFDGTNWVLERSQPEYLSSTISSGAALLLANGSPLTITSISVPAGEWDARATMAFTGTSPSVAYFIGSISIATNTVGAAHDGSSQYSPQFNLAPFSVLSIVAFPVGPYRLSLPAATTMYLVGQCGFSGGTVSAYGNLNLRRVRT